MPLTIEPIGKYNYSKFLSAMISGPPKSGKSCSALTMVQGEAGQVCSKLVVVAFDEGSLIGPRRMALDRGLGDLVVVVDMEAAAAGAVSKQGQTALCDTVWSMQKELNDRAKKGEFGPAPGLWYASLTTMAEGVEREVRTCVASGGRYDLYHMNPDKWNIINATHANMRLLLSQWPGHKVVEAHLDPPASDKAVASLSLTGKQKAMYPKQFAQLLELRVEPAIMGGRKTPLRVFDTRADGGWTKGVREGDERLNPQEPADWSVVASKLGLDMVSRKEAVAGATSVKEK